MREKIVEILNKYKTKTGSLSNEGQIDPMDFHKIADEVVEVLTPLKSQKEQLNIPAAKESEGVEHKDLLFSLDGKTISVTFHVSKFEPKIDTDLNCW